MAQHSAFEAMIAFVKARLDEDAAAAKAAPYELDENWFSLPSEDGPAGAGEHYERHDPARVLREVAAKRAILWRCALWVNEPDLYPNGLVSSRAVLARQTIADAATVYGDHPEYRQEWKP